jgi:hypothetical protein
MFDPDSRVSILGTRAFRRSPLKSICIPSSVQIISDFCFYESKDLTDVSFESGSKLSILGKLAFGFCKFRKSVSCIAVVSLI